MAWYPPITSVWIDFTTSPIDASASWTEVTQYVTGRVSFEHGRSSAIDDFQPGRGRLTLINDDGRFDPSNTTGPHYGQLTARRPIRLVVNPTDTSFANEVVIGQGFVEGWPQRWEGRGQGFVDIEFTDLWGIFAQIDMPESVWDWEVKTETPKLWYKLGDSVAPYAADSGSLNRRGEWRVYEGNAQTPLHGTLMPKAILEAGKKDSIITSSDRQSVSFASLQSEIGQPLIGISGTPRSPAFIPAWESQWYPSANFTAAMWVLHRTAFPLSASNAYEAGFPIIQPLFTWGLTEGHYWQLSIRTDGLLEMRFTVGSTTFATTPFGPSLDSGQPHFVAIGREGNFIHIVIDGTLEASVNITTALPAPVFPVVVGAAKGNVASLQSTIGDIVLWDRYVPSYRQSELYYAGRYGTIDPGIWPLLTDVAFEQGFRLADVPLLSRTNDIFEGMYCTETISGQTFADYLRTLGATEQGLLFVDPAGLVRFYSAWWPTRTRSANVQWTLGDTAASTIGYAELTFKDPLDELENHCTVNYPGGSAEAENTASMTTYGKVSNTIDTFLMDGEKAKAIAEHRVWKYGTPPPDGVIPDELIIQPNTLAEFQMVTDLRIADRLHVTKTRPNGTTIVKEVWVQYLRHEYDAHLGGEWTTTVGLQLADYPAKPFVLDSSSLNSTDVLWI